MHEPFTSEYTLWAVTHSAIIAITIGVFTYIVDRRHQLDTKELEETKTRLQAITDSARDGIVMMRPDGTMTFLNPAAEQIFGYAPGELIGRSVHETLIPGEFADGHAMALPAFSRTGEGPLMGTTIEVTGLRKGGAAMDIALSLSSVNVQGEWHAVGVIRDITKRKRQERELESANNARKAMLEEKVRKYQDSIESFDAGFYRTTLDGRLLVANSRFVSMLGYGSLEELMELPLNALYATDDGRAEFLSALREKGRLSKRELVVVRKDGTRLTVYDDANLVGNTITGFISNEPADGDKPFIISCAWCNRIYVGEPPHGTWVGPADAFTEYRFSHSICDTCEESVNNDL